MRNTAAWKIAFAALGALAAGAAGAGKPGNPAAVVQALAEKPHVLSELEAIVGSLHRDPAQWEQAVGPLHRVSPGPGIARADVELAIDPSDAGGLERGRNADHLPRSPRALASRAGTDVGRSHGTIHPLTGSIPSGALSASRTT
jgi:hypothetical protein